MQATWNDVRPGQWVLYHSRGGQVAREVGRIQFTGMGVFVTLLGDQQDHQVSAKGPVEIVPQPPMMEGHWDSEQECWVVKVSTGGGPLPAQVFVGTQTEPAFSGVILPEAVA